MRWLFIVGLLAVVGCATATGPGTMEWNTIPAHLDGAPEPVVRDGALVLSGRAIRSHATYTAPVTLECELQSGRVSSNDDFYVDFVPQGAPAAAVSGEYVSFRLRSDNTLEVWASRSNQPPHLISKSMGIPIDAQRQYKLVLEVQRGGFAAHVNGAPMTVDLPMPYDKFQIELRSFPPPGPWVIRSFSIH